MTESKRLKRILKSAETHYKRELTELNHEQERWIFGAANIDILKERNLLRVYKDTWPKGVEWAFQLRSKFKYERKCWVHPFVLKVFDHYYSKISSTNPIPLRTAIWDVLDTWHADPSQEDSIIGLLAMEADQLFQKRLRFKESMMSDPLRTSDSLYLGRQDYNALMRVQSGASDIFQEYYVTLKKRASIQFEVYIPQPGDQIVCIGATKKPSQSSQPCPLCPSSGSGSK